jgi:hypothetical protein
MKFRKFGRTTLALAVSLGTGLGVTSCSTNHTVGYMYVTGTQYSQISGFKIDNNLGNLTITPNSPYGSGGYNPTKDLVTNAGRFLYVLNAGCGGTAQIACPSGANPSDTGANISLFTIGGKGAISFQASYTSQGNQPISMQTDSSGTHLFVLDTTVPDPTTCKGYVSGDPATICGDITSFNIDPNTGRLSLITNETVKNANGTNLSYFPVGSSPINFFVIPSNSFVYTRQWKRGRSQTGCLRLRAKRWPVNAVPEHADSHRRRGSFLYLCQRQVHLFDRCPGRDDARHNLALHRRHQWRAPIPGRRRSGKFRYHRQSGNHDRRPPGKIPVPGQPGAQPDGNQPGKFGKRLLHRSDHGPVDAVGWSHQQYQCHLWLRLRSKLYS